MSTPIYKKGFVAVGNGHELYFECFGNSSLPPILFIHGGPGSGFNEGYKRFFDPLRHHVIFYDQRGSGKSKPYLSLTENTTHQLIDDIIKLLDFLHINKVIIFGASWGATLGLLFAIHYPKRALAAVLMSIFLATRKESKRFVDGSTAQIFPAAWERFVSLVPHGDQQRVAEYYFNKMLHGSNEEKEKCAFNWALYDISLSTGEFSAEKLNKTIRTISYQSLALITAYYIIHDFFLPDRYILKNTKRIAHIPIALIQSTADIVTPPNAAVQLHGQLPNSTLDLIDSAHAGKMLIEKSIERLNAFLFEIHSE
jgi:proline iminopeptidase